MPSSNSDQDFIQELDRILSSAKRDARQRLATYVRRYMSPLLINELFEQGKLGILMQSMEIPIATVMIADIRGYTPQTSLHGRTGRGLQSVADLLQDFFVDALETVFEYKGVMGEFSGDKFMAIFGIPFLESNDADRAVLAAMEIYENAVELNRKSRIERQHYLTFDIGIGVSTGGPVWIGDIGSDWRRELTMIGNVINAASRIEELTKEEEIANIQSNYNIIVSSSTLENLSKKLKSHMDLHELAPRRLRGLGETPYQSFKITDYRGKSHIVQRERINTATQRVVDAIAQKIESIQEREDAVRLGKTLQDIGQGISSSLDLDIILESVMDSIQNFLSASTASLLLIEEGTNRLSFKAVRPKENLSKLKEFEDKLMIGTGIVGYVAQTGESLCLPDAQKDTRFYSRPDAKTGFETRSVLCTPIVLDNKTVGVIQVIDNHTDMFDKQNLNVLEVIAAFTASAIRNARQHAQVTQAETLAAMSIVTSDIAHQLKNDIGLIKIRSQSLLSKLGAGQQVDLQKLDEALQFMVRKSDHLMSTMEEIRHPFTDLNPEKTDIREVLDSTIDSVLAKGENAKTENEPKIRIHRQYEDCPEIMIDKARLISLFYKIMENSVRALENSKENEGSKEKEITIQLRVLMNAIEVKIADTGPGIPPEMRPDLFQLISPKSNREEATSTQWGYGLWSSRLFVQSLGGKIFLDEDYSGGTCIVIQLPNSHTDLVE
jgi:signal transduction histidine kinase/class 3 adenylate cyclase